MFSSLALVCLGLFMLLFRISPDVGCSQITAGLCDLEELVRRHSSCCFCRTESDGCTSITWKGSACSSLQLSQAAQDKPLLGSVISKRHLGSSDSWACHSSHRTCYLGFNSLHRTSHVLGAFLLSFPSWSASAWLFFPSARALPLRTSRCLKQYRFSRQSLWACSWMHQLGKENTFYVPNLNRYYLGTTLTVNHKASTGHSDSFCEEQESSVKPGFKKLTPISTTLSFHYFHMFQGQEQPEHYLCPTQFQLQSTSRDCRSS